MRKDSVIVCHLKTGRSIRGRFLRTSRRFHELAKFEIEADGTFIVSDNTRCLIPRDLVEVIEVV